MIVFSVPWNRDEFSATKIVLYIIHRIFMWSWSITIYNNDRKSMKLHVHLYYCIVEYQYYSFALGLIVYFRFDQIQTLLDSIVYENLFLLWSNCNIFSLPLDRLTSARDWEQFQTACTGSIPYQLPVFPGF